MELGIVGLGRMGQIVAERSLAADHDVVAFDIDDEAAVRVLERIGETDYRITRGANERVQLEAMLASLAQGE